MTELGDAIYAKAKSYEGKLHDGPDVPMMAREVGRIWPSLAAYGNQARNDTPWCGIFAAYVVSQLGIRPPPVDSDGVGYMWVDTWKGWGTPVPVAQRQPGDAALFLGNPHHINFVGQDGKFVGGNQGDAVTEGSYRTPDYVRRAPAAAGEPVASDRFNICLARVLRHEGGNADDPRDPGARTSRGITAERWAEWRTTHPGLPADVWQAPQSEVVAIYRQKYWDVLWCDQLPVGVDYAVFDFGVNSGPARAASFLQEIVGSAVDGEVGPNTVAATKAADPEEVINTLCDDRMEFLQGLGTWPTYKNGWTKRVADVRRDALADAGAAPRPEPEPIEEPDEPATDDVFAAVDRVQKSLDATQAALDQLKEQLGMTAQQPAPQVDLSAILQNPVVKEIIAKLLPQVLPLLLQYLPSLLPLILQLLFKQPAAQQKTAVSPTITATAGAVGGGTVVAILTALANHFLGGG